MICYICGGKMEVTTGGTNICQCLVEKKQGLVEKKQLPKTTIRKIEDGNIVDGIICYLSDQINYSVKHETKMLIIPELREWIKIRQMIK